MHSLTWALLGFSLLAHGRQVSSNAHLRVEVYHQTEVPVQYQNKSLIYSPIVYTLISSTHEAVLVDTPSLSVDGEALASWIASVAPGKKLRYIYITHAHVDHFGAFTNIMAKFPEARVVTTKGVKAHMPAQYEEPLWSSWKGLFPTITKVDLDLVQALDSDRFAIEDGRYEFRAIEVGGGDTADSTVLYIPEVDLVVGGDVVYGRCHQYLAENPTPEDRKAWVKSLSKISDLKPKWVVPSHMQTNEDFGMHHIKETVDYVETWDGWLASGKVGSWQELEEMAKKRWPDRMGSLNLRSTAQSFFNMML
jgi:glyoxylase-like metal-dependent hydrolase (beta-lactamase superfamily II)